MHYDTTPDEEVLHTHFISLNHDNNYPPAGPGHVETFANVE